MTDIVEKKKKPRWRKWRRLAVFAAVFVLLVGPWRGEWIELCNRGVQEKAQLAVTKVVAGLPETIPASPFRAGAAKEDLTTVGSTLPLAGYAKRVFQANSGVADPIAVRALVLENSDTRIAIVCVELLLVNRLLAETVMSDLEKHGSKLTRPQVYFAATHTHSAPGGFAGTLAERFAIGVPRADVLEETALRIARTIVEAEKKLEPAEWTTASMEASAEIIHNRTKETDPANRWFDILAVRRRGESRMLASLGVFSAHATCRPASDLRVSGDYPGVFSRLMEEGTSGVALFAAGAVGSMGPSAPDARADMAEFIGRNLAEQARRSLASAKWNSDIALAAVGFRHPLPNPAVKIGGGWCVSPFLAARLMPAGAWIQAIRVGDRVFLGAPADYSGNLAESLRGSATNLQTVVTSFAGDYVGYILPDAYYEIPKYEPRSMALYGRHLGSLFQQSFTSVAEALGR